MALEEKEKEKGEKRTGTEAGLQLAGSNSLTDKMIQVQVSEAGLIAKK